VASELVAGAVAACKEQTYNVTAVVLDIDGVRQAMLRLSMARPYRPATVFDFRWPLARGRAHALTGEVNSYPDTVSSVDVRSARP
jgi:uncharacterized protein GlcG (DUF336 family)